MEKPDIYFIVYMFRPNNYFKTRFIIGIYETLREAEEKQKEFCGKNWKKGLNNSITGLRGGERVTTWIKKFTQGTVMEQP